MVNLLREPVRTPIFLFGPKLMDLDSPPSPSMSKRHSVRRERNALSRISDGRPASDSNIDYTLRNFAASSANNELAFPEAPHDIPDWIRRRDQMNRPAAVPIQPPTETAIYELDAGPALPLDEDDEALAQAIERSHQEMFGPPRRTNTGTNEDELARVIELSLREK